MNEDLIYVNGIDGGTGKYLQPAIPAEQVARLALGESIEADLKLLLEERHAKDTENPFALIEGISATDLGKTGWGVIFAVQDQDKIPAIKEALDPLIKWRTTQAGDLFKIYEGPNMKGGGYRAGESALKFAARNMVDVTQPVDPMRMPYYLLIIGDPEAIPYRFQYQMDVQYAVGRINFDTLDEYEQYAKAVVMAEEGRLQLSRHAAVFGVKTPGDQATQLSAQYLVEPLLGKLSKVAGWTTESYLEDQAMQGNLSALLNQQAPPALLFSASHGMGFANGHPRQFKHQGALLCQDWPGPDAWSGEIPENFYFSGDHIKSDANLSGMIAFMFACYGAGTPRMDDYPHQKQISAQPVAPNAFVARLPQRMLGRGALAVIGHVERAWTYSFKLKESEQIQSFESTFRAMMAGQPVGYAMEYFNQRYAAVSSNLSTIIEDHKQFPRPLDVQEQREISSLWTTNNDARSYVILGDPAAHLPLAAPNQAPQRDKLPEINFETARAVPASAPPAGTEAEASHLSAPAQPPDSVSPGQTTASRTEAGSKAAATGQPFALPVDGLAFALQAYTSDQDVSFLIGEEGQSFNLIDDAKAKVREIVVDLNRALVNLASKMAQATSDAATLSITTIVADDLNQLSTETLEPRYKTEIGATGDVKLYVSRHEMEGDELLRSLHREMVSQAMQNRMEFIKAISETIASLFGAK